MRISATLDLVDLERSNIDLAVRLVPVAERRGPVLFEEQVQPMCSPMLLRDARRPLRTPADLVRQKKLVAPFRTPAASRRGYFVALAAHAAHNPDAHAFAAWLLAEAGQAGTPAARPARARLAGG